jgi:hypothetical protein
MKFMLSLSLLASLGFASAASAADLAVPAPVPAAPVGYGVPPVVVQLGPTTTYSSINCANFTKLPDGSWKALDGQLFGLGFVQKIVPPVIPIKSGGFIYNNIDLYSQLELQCQVALVRARY